MTPDAAQDTLRAGAESALDCRLLHAELEPVISYLAHAERIEVSEEEISSVCASAARARPNNDPPHFTGVTDL
jgi:hypothetical protein